MTVLDDFIDDARNVPLEVAFKCVKGELGRKCIVKGAVEYIGRCPACGGKDRFSINFSGQVWFCRQSDRRGGDALQLIAHKEGLDLKRKAHLLEACAILLDRPIPSEGERESDEDRAAREKLNAERIAAIEAQREKNEKSSKDFRDKEIDKARGIWGRGQDGKGSAVEAYLCRRIGATALPHGLWENLCFVPDLTYWHGKDERGNPRDIHCGPAMVAPMVDLTGHITGCHQTWIDLGNAPKFRPDLGLDDDGERLTTKKMRGHTKGSLIPVLGDLNATRWVVIEGIETTLAIAMIDGWRQDTFYVAAGSLGNMGGSADPASAFNHPLLKVTDSKGRKKPVRVPGPVPKVGAEADCFQVPAYVTDLLLGTDGDSELYFTISAMARAEARLSREGLAIVHLPRLEGADYSETTAHIHDGTARAA